MARVCPHGNLPRECRGDDIAGLADLGIGFHADGAVFAHFGGAGSGQRGGVSGLFTNVAAARAPLPPASTFLLFACKTTKKTLAYCTIGKHLPFVQNASATLKYVRIRNDHFLYRRRICFSYICHSHCDLRAAATDSASREDATVHFHRSIFDLFFSICHGSCLCIRGRPISKNCI